MVKIKIIVSDGRFSYPIGTDRVDASHAIDALQEKHNYSVPDGEYVVDTPEYVGYSDLAWD